MKLNELRLCEELSYRRASKSKLSTVLLTRYLYMYAHMVSNKIACVSTHFFIEVAMTNYARS